MPPNPPELPPAEIGRRVGWAHCWMVRVLNDRAIFWFRANSACSEFLRIWVQGDLECIFERIKPAHTVILWEYPQPLPVP